MEQGNRDKELKVLQEIEENISSRIRPGVAWAELKVLDDVNASRRSIQELGAKIAANNPELSAAILEISYAIYFGYTGQGRPPDFFDAVLRLGSDRMKTLLFALNLFALDKGREARKRAARSASISVLGKLIAEEMHLKDDLVRRVETGGLLSQLGRSLLMKARELGMDLSDEFIDRNERLLATRLVDRLQLDPFLKHVMELSCLEFDEKSLSLAGIIRLAESIADDSFRQHGKLVVRSPLPDEDGILSWTPAAAILRLFSVLGIEEFLEIQETPTQRQLDAKNKGKAKQL